MADEKSGHSRKETDWLGDEYTQHYDEDGKTAGSSREQTDWLGDKYTQHYDDDGRATGSSRGEKDWLGDDYRQHHDNDGKASGSSRQETDWLGDKYTQHYDNDGKTSGHSRREKDWLGDDYVQHHGAREHSNDDRTESGSSSSGGSYASDSGGGYGGSDSSSSDYSPSEFVEFLWALPALLILGGIVVALYQYHTTNNSGTNRNGTPSNVAYVTAPKLNLRSGPGTQFKSITQLSSGDSVTCLERQTDGDGTVWLHVRAAGMDGWVNEKHLTSAPSNVATAAPPQGAVLLAKAGAAPFYASVTRLAFFEAGQNAPSVGSRNYTTRFDAASARYVYWQLDLAFSLPGQRVTVPLKAVYTGPGGIVARESVQLDVQPDWTSAYFNYGYGAPSPGWWKPGTYRVEVMTAAGNRVASGSFEVYGDRPVEIPNEPTLREPYPRDTPSVAPSEEEPVSTERPILRRRAQPTQRVSGGVLTGKAIRRLQPPYPPAARIAGVEGTVVVEVTVDEQGHVIEAHAVSGPAMLQEAAVQAARRWVFAPTLLSGTPVQVTGTITFNFKRG